MLNYLMHKIYAFMLWKGQMCFKCIDDLKGSGMRKKQNTAKAKGVRSSINLLT